METIRLPEALRIKSIHLVCWQATFVPNPNTELLKAILNQRSRQGRISRKRQAFITGMATNRIPGEERGQRGAYLEEWHIRISDNEDQL